MTPMDTSARHLRVKSRRRAFLLPGAAIALLLAQIAWMLSSFGGEASCTSSFVGFLLITLIAPWAILRFRTRIKSIKHLAQSEEILALFRAGQYQDAAERWESLVKSGTHPGPHAIFVYNIGMSCLHMGAFSDARVLMARAKDSGWFAVPAYRGIAPNVEAGVALLEALEGNIERAREITASLQRSVPDARKPITMLVTAICDAREGKDVFFDARALRLAESVLMAAHVRALKLIALFSRSRAAEGAYRAAHGEASDALDIHPGELDFLATKWPELAQFMQARGYLGDQRRT